MAKIKEEQMSNSHNDIGLSVKESSLPMNQLLTNRLDAIRAEHIKRAADCAHSTAQTDIADGYPEVATELDVDKAAEYLVAVFNSPRSKAFYCDCARHIGRDSIIQAIRSATTLRTNKPIKSPPAYFGRICTKKLVKLGIYK